MRVGDIVEVDGVRARVLDSSKLGIMDFEEIKSKKRRWINVSIIGNPRIMMVKRNPEGRELPLTEYPHHLK